MIISYENKKSEEDIIAQTANAKLRTVFGENEANKLIHGDNLPVLKTLLDRYAGKVDLIYIDSPFATNGHFKISEDRASTTRKMG